MVKSVDPMAPKPIPNNPIVPQPVKAMGQWYRGSTLDRAKKATDMSPATFRSVKSLREFAHIVHSKWTKNGWQQ